MTFRLLFAIDPGLTGAVATLIDDYPGPILDMPTIEHGDWNEVDGARLAAWIRGIRGQHPGAFVHACIEKVGAMPGDGGTSAFRFGESSGKVKAVLESLGIPYTRVVPQSWKRYFGLLKTEKDAARLRAIQRFPQLADQLARKKDGGRADAILIAVYCADNEIGPTVAIA